MTVAAAAVAVARMRELAGRRQVLSRDCVPPTVYHAGSRWFTEVLCSGIPGAKVISVEPRGGDVATHERRQLHLQYNAEGQEAGLPEFVFTKSLPTLTTRMLVGYMGHARYEMLFYRHIRPCLAIETPRCFYSGSNRSTLAALHVLEDVSVSKGATFCDENTVLTADLAAGLVDLLATLHGSLYDSPRFGDDLRWLTPYETWFTKGVERVGTRQHMDKALDAVGDIADVRVMRRRRELWPAVVNGVEIHRSAPQVVLHSDVHVGNWYVTDAAKMGLLDWQCTVRGHWARDLSYALATALTVEQRRAWERDLVDRYADALSSASGTSVSRHAAWELYRQQVLHALTMWTQVVSHPRLMPNSHTPSMIHSMISRITTAIADLDSISAAGSDPKER